ncbi:MAG: Crp/Fnr family transcriptional regulator [Lachnospiraceae bacterium]|nr:Crp/Fnr family transcriptional regulator [Lachnospiraceae bacterium]
MNLFSDIEQKEIDKMLLCSRAVRKKVSAGEYIFQQGETPRMIFMLQSGEVALVKDFASGKRNLLYTVKPGDVFGEAFLFSGQMHYWYDAAAVKPSEVLQIPWKFFYGFCENACGHHKMITRNLLEILAGRNFSMTKKLHLLSSTSLKEKLAIYFLENADSKGRVALSMNREMFADFLGVARPSLSRELMNMQKEGLIVVDRDEVRICDREALECFY